MSRFSSRLTSGRNRTPRTTLKMAALAPIPKASVTTTVIARPLTRPSERSANLKSVMKLINGLRSSTPEPGVASGKTPIIPVSTGETNVPRPRPPVPYQELIGTSPSYSVVSELPLDIHLIDGTYELFRHYYALPSARDRHGREIGAVRGVVTSVLGMINGGA